MGLLRAPVCLNGYAGVQKTVRWYLGVLKFNIRVQNVSVGSGFSGASKGD